MQSATVSKSCFRTIRNDEFLVWKLDRELPESFIVGQGNVLFLSGWCYHRQGRIRRLSVLLDGRLHRIVNHSLGDVETFSSQPLSLDKAGKSLTSRFWTALPFDKINGPAEVELTLQVDLDNGRSCESYIGKLALRPAVERHPTEYPLEVSGGDGSPLVVICMASYNPPLDLFASQIESLIRQTHQNWLCIISDDHSAEDVWEGMSSIVARDKRFVLSRNPQRLGVYRNFERCLHLVPSAAEFVALADQDDYWHPDKLEKSLAAFQTEMSLVYSDMEVVSRQGEVISRTFWATRENNYTDLEALLYANTVTGAATVFRAGLLDDLLPFPSLPGDAYHDHWIACVALTKGTIGYVAEPLYSWLQHEDNACGFASTQTSKVEKWMELKTLIYLFVLFLRRSTNFGAYLTCLRQQYRDYFVELIALAQVLRLRVKHISEDKRATLERILKFEHSLPALAIQAARFRVLKKATLGRELTCFRVAFSVRLFDIYCRMARHLFQRRRADALLTAPLTSSATRGKP